MTLNAMTLVKVSETENVLAPMESLQITPIADVNLLKNANLVLVNHVLAQENGKNGALVMVFAVQELSQIINKNFKKHFLSNFK